jgi:hypothetical protein
LTRDISIEISSRSASLRPLRPWAALKASRPSSTAGLLARPEKTFQLRPKSVRIFTSSALASSSASSSFTGSFRVRRV